MEDKTVYDFPIVDTLTAWATPLFITQLPEHDAIKSALLKVIYAARDSHHSAIASEVALSAKQSLYESPLDFLMTEDPVISSLRKRLEALLLMVAEEVNHQHWPEEAKTEAIITESWFHITENGGFHDAHSHPNCSWCGIYFIDTDACDFSQRNGVNRFYDPRINADHYLDAGALYLNAEGIWDIEPIEGQVVLFPSYLKHSALPYFAQKDRVVIAFNCQVKFMK